MEVRVEGRGLEVLCHRDTNRGFYAAVLFFVLFSRHGTVCGLGLGSLAGCFPFFGPRDLLMLISSYRSLLFHYLIPLYYSFVVCIFFSTLGRYFFRRLS